MPRSETMVPDPALAAYGEGAGRHLEALRVRQDQARRALRSLTPPNWRRGRGFSLTPDPVDLSAYAPRRGEIPVRGVDARDKRALVIVDGVLAGVPTHLPEDFEVYLLGPGGSDILPDDIVSQIASVVRPDADFYSALNLAALTSAIVVRVRAGKAPKDALRIRHVLRSDGTVALARVVLVIEGSARATVIEETVSEMLAGRPATDALTAPVTEMTVGDGAHLVYADLSELSPTHRALLRRRAVLGRDSRLEWRSGLFGGRFVAADWETELIGEGSEVEVTGTYLAAGQDKFALTSRTWHRGPHTKAQVLFRGAAYGRSQSVFDGIIGADKEAKGTQAYLSDHLLFLSPEARADSIPSLLIEGDDVNVGHGATIGRIDPEQIYFMQSRGIDPEDARRLLVAGYFDPLLDRIPDEELKEAQRARIQRRLSGISDVPQAKGRTDSNSQSPLIGTDLEHQVETEGR